MHKQLLYFFNILYTWLKNLKCHFVVEILKYAVNKRGKLVYCYKSTFILIFSLQNHLSLFTDLKFIHLLSCCKETKGNKSGFPSSRTQSPLYRAWVEFFFYWRFWQTLFFRLPTKNNKQHFSTVCPKMHRLI